MCLRKDYYVFARTTVCPRTDYYVSARTSIICISISIICMWNMNEQVSGVIVAARVHVPDTDDAGAVTDDDAGPCEDIVVLAKTHSGASENT